MRFLLLCLMFLSCVGQLQADDRGWRVSPGISGLVGIVDQKVDFRIGIDVDLTYLMFNQLELGFGVGYQKQHFNYDHEETYSVNNEPYHVPVYMQANNTVPYYLVGKYNFDINETGYLVAAVKIGKFAVVDGSAGSESEYSYDTDTKRFTSFSLGYDLDGTVISGEYRINSYNQSFSYFNSTDGVTLRNDYKKRGHYIGFHISQKIDLF